MTDTIYHYHPTTGEYAGSSPADHSPLEPGVVLIPAHATDQAPPAAGPHEVAVLREGSWSVAADWRGVALFSKADGSAVTIADIGTTPADVNATETARPSAAHAWRAGKWIEDAQLKASLLVALRQRLCDQLDAAADAVRLAVVGDPLRAVEYERAADEALAYQGAGYAGDVPPSVQSAADATGSTARQAADAILAKHAAWDAVLYDLRALRLKGKEVIRRAVSDEEAAQAADEAIASVRGRASGERTRYE
ncbi:phage tail protein [Ralstonia pseudosolanacearum]|uniref:phage tail protein n=1 Tax=Ralstonia pseudosolanacearum TaxID=1310165 RepID=UPI000E59355F|nr:phage tail protein [Ralstonia pseudosolanacearum]AXW01378.1 phage tail protein [Ralstonia solanacearum]AXW28857.1 phage tail protein [Ralstonia solanacearum]AXW47637.1 phage tail protein [Ralstonia solanacearum]NJZ67927.1 phage tail protein [Ralstonia solanacearum]NJZ77743.1 phage tail protein [Ralstonia solanacearum]